MVSASPTYGVMTVGFNAGATRLAVGGTDCLVYLYAIEDAENSDGPFPQIRFLTVLRGHSNHIVQVLFSRTGNSIVTACRDGTARIWNRTKARLPLGRKRKQSVAGMGHWSSVVLDCRPQVQADARSTLSGAASGSACGSIVPRVRHPNFPVCVDAAMWSLTDKYVFTASSDAKIRMWHADTGKLARVFEEHEREVYVMDCHPTDKRIFLSAGYDGKCILWDIETGKQLRKFSIPEEGRDHTAPFGSPKRPSFSDGQFSPDGLSFAVSDTSGAITLFGIGSPEAMALAPEEQFFSRDCSSYRRDQQGRAIDERTGLLLHMIPKGRLCDKQLCPHPPELQPNLFHLSSSRKDRSEEDSHGVTGSQKVVSPNAVQNKNRDALLLRAREFRENQEKQERRLLREAREARRRLIVEKEKADLERDINPFHLALRDFEVQDSDCDDSDEDFDGENIQERSESSSSSSDEDEIRPVKRSRSAGREQPKLELFKRNIGKVKSKRGLRKRKASGRNTVESDGSGGNEDEGPDYEVGSKGSDSEDSESSSEDERSVKARKVAGQSRSDAKNVQTSNLPAQSKGQSNDREVAHGGAGRFSSSCRTLSFQPTSRLGGASVGDGGRRMKIRLKPSLNVPSPQRHGSTAVNRDCAAVRSSEIEPALDDVHVAQNMVAAASSRGSIEARALMIDTPFTTEHPPRNPSFTSERKDNRAASDRVSKPVEDHQGDTASCIRPRTFMDDLEERKDAVHCRDNITQQHSSVEKSPAIQRSRNLQMDSKSYIENAAYLHIQRHDGNEKSLLSDSPARLVKRDWRNRTRSSAARTGDQVILAPEVDIDELAERELQLLDAEGSRKHRRRRRKRASLEFDGEDVSSDEGFRKRSRRGDREDHEAPKRSRKRGGKGNSSSAQREQSPRENSAEEPIGLSASAWLRSSSNRYTYVPQLGDDVMYFPEGHSSAITISKEAGLDPFLGKLTQTGAGKEVLDGTSFQRDSAPIRFQIMDLSYEFPVLLSQRPHSLNSRATDNAAVEGQEPGKRKTVVVLTLRVISGMARPVSDGDRFLLAYYPVDAPEYLVLTSRVEGALYRSWKARDRFRILFLNERRAWQYYTGTIRRVKPSMKTVMWNTVEVEYDNESDKEKGVCELVSPWELETHDPFQVAREASLQYSQSLRSSTVEPGLFPIIAREFEAVRAMESNWRAQLSCLDTVDMLAAIPGYCNTIPCPMDLNTLLVRLCTGYYRHFCSFIHDISLLKSNAIRFHGAQSEMGMLSINLFTRLAETAERLRVQFVTSMVPVQTNNNLVQSMPTSHTGSRVIRPRPVFGEGAAFSGAAAGQIGLSNGLRQFPVPLTPRQAGSVVPAPLPHLSQDATGTHPAASGSQQRIWSNVRQVQSIGHGVSMLHGQSLGVALPPASPGMGHPGVVTRGGRASRGRSRESQQGRQAGGSQSRRASVGAVTRNISSPPPTSTGLISQSSGLQHGGPVSHSAPQIVHGNNYHPTQVTMVANSNQPNEAGRGIVKLLAPSSALSQVRGLPRPTVQLGSAQAMATTTSPENGRVYVNSTGMVSPQQSGQVGGSFGASQNAAQSQAQRSMSKNQSRGGAAFVDGGTHSWGRSMEGAGGMFPLQASTSDSHLPVPAQSGRSPSPTSPSAGQRDARNSTRRQQGVSRVIGTTTAYHEHSTVSVAAAESTMSCGGADVALLAASAESGEITAERPSN
eukprot:GFKZ01005364.1.p1 GENE.GFKZ01005364.1~~GFKZ01005364.1.p1  ORF type:complete len:1702 (+),score=185.67 GFKZ01005364.1:1374-6479(+)